MVGGGGEGGAGGLGPLVPGATRDGSTSGVGGWWSGRVALVLVAEAVWPAGTPGSATYQREVPEKAP